MAFTRVSSGAVQRGEDQVAVLKEPPEHGHGRGTFQCLVSALVLLNLPFNAGIESCYIRIIENEFRLAELLNEFPEPLALGS